MKYILPVLFLSIFNLAVYAQNSRIEYISQYQLLAIKEMNRSGIPASIKMAQACLESADGNSTLAKKSNNHFGIKCKSNWNGQNVYHDDDAKNECFRKYKSIEDSYIDHTNFIMESQRYQFLFDLDPTDYKGWAHGLKKAGYATAPNYGKSLIDLIEKFQLYRLDYKISNNEIALFEQKRIGNQNISNTLSINPFQTHHVEKTNRVKSVVARQGDTYEILAQEFRLNVWEIYKFNDQVPGYVPQPNEIVYVHAKKRKAYKINTSHIVQPGESMHFISQLYGIKLKPLYSRNKMKYGQQAIIGQTIFLR